MARAGAPGPVNAIGVANIAPAIMAYGTDEQKQRFLRPMLRGDEIWSQGMSEPEAGSDLASLRSRRSLDGDDFVVNGQKTWNSPGHRADWCQLYVRTNPDGPKHKGITCLLVDMRTPGIEARPITTMAGDHSVQRAVPHRRPRAPLGAARRSTRAGASPPARSATSAPASPASTSRRGKLDRLLAATGGRRARRSRRPRRVAALHQASAGGLATPGRRRAIAFGEDGAEGSVAKLAWAPRPGAGRVGVDLLGMGAVDGRWGWELPSSRPLSIAGGTTEVNRTIIGEHVLGLPR